MRSSLKKIREENKGLLKLSVVWSAAMILSLYVYLNDNLELPKSSYVGVLSSHSGDVTFRNPTFAVWSSVRPDQLFESGAVVSTGANSNATIELFTGQQIRMQQNSQVSLGEEKLLSTQSFLVSVLRGNLQVEQTRGGQVRSAALAKLDSLFQNSKGPNVGLFSNKSSAIQKLKIQAKQNVATLSSDSFGTIISIESSDADNDSDFSLETIKGSIEVQNIETGQVATLYPSQKLEVSEPQPGTSEDTWISDLENNKENTKTNSEMVLLHSFNRNQKNKITLPFSYEVKNIPSSFLKPENFEASGNQRIPLKVAIAGQQKEALFSLKMKDSNRITYQHTMTNKEAEQIEFNGSANLSMSLLDDRGKKRATKNIKVVDLSHPVFADSTLSFTLTSKSSKRLSLKSLENGRDADVVLSNWHMYLADNDPDKLASLLGLAGSVKIENQIALKGLSSSSIEHHFVRDGKVMLSAQVRSTVPQKKIH